MLLHFAKYIMLFFVNNFLCDAALKSSLMVLLTCHFYHKLFFLFVDLLFCSGLDVVLIHRSLNILFMSKASAVIARTTLF